MKKTVILTERELIKVIKKIISEQQKNPILDLQNFLISKKYQLKADGLFGPKTSAALNDYLKKNPAESKNPVIQNAMVTYRQSEKRNVGVGANARQAVVAGAKAIGGAVKDVAVAAVKGATETVITIGKTVLTVVLVGGYVLYKIGESFFKVGKALSDVILKFLTATGRAVVKTATQLSQATMAGLTKIGVYIEKGIESVKVAFERFKDASYYVITTILNAFKEFGIKAWAQVLIAATKIKEFGQNIWNWVKKQYDSIASQIGVAWDDAVKGATDFAKGALNTAADYAGRAVGFTKGFLGLQEFFIIYHSMNGYSTKEILFEMKKNNGKRIIL